MAKDFREMVGLIALSRAAEATKGTPIATAVSMYFNPGAGIDRVREKVTDDDLVNGLEGGENIFEQFYTAEGTLPQEMAKPDFCGFVFGFWYGSDSTAAAGSSGFTHTFSPLAAIDHPAFTMVQRRGKGDTAAIMKEQSAHVCVNEFTLSLTEGWVSMEATLIGAGVRADNYFDEAVTGTSATTSLTLDTNGVQGTDAVERLSNVDIVRVKKDGEAFYTIVNVIAVDASTPAVLTVDAAGTTTDDSVSYEVFYYPTANAWETMPANIFETPLRLVEAKIVLDGTFNGTTVEGGHSISCDHTELSVNGTNGIIMKHCPDGSTTLSASDSKREKRELTVTLGKRLNGILFQRLLEKNSTISFQLIATGAEIDSGEGNNFRIEIVIPLMGIMEDPKGEADGNLNETMTLKALEDATYGFGRAFVVNQISAAYAA